MDQLKEFLNQAIKYRFWIAIGVAAILSLSAYFLGTGAMAEEEKKEVAKIKGAVDALKPFGAGTIKNTPWTAVVTEKTALVQKDVNASWTKLYELQAPLLDWPTPVKKQFEDPAWDRKYPEGVDPQRVRDVILEYTQAYPDYADAIYRSVKPFNPEDGTGIVSSPSKGELLHPQVYQEDKPPSLSDVWAAQQKLWIQRTILKVIADVNAKVKAKDWDTAVIKQIQMLEVANAFAVDQKTDAKGEGTLEDPPEILVPGQTSAADKAAAGTSAAPVSGSARFGGGAEAATAPEKIQFLKSPNPDQYYIVPIALTVLIEQDRIPDLLVEFKNSPMSIRVLDFRVHKPTTPVKKPRKGQVPAGGGGMGAMAGRMGGLGGGLLGGEMLASPTAGGGRTMEDSGYQSGGLGGSYNKSMRSGGGISGIGGNTAKARAGGKDVKAENLKALAASKNKKDKGDKKSDGKDDEESESTLSNPYFNVVEVTIRGQARFYKAPPKSAQPEVTSPGANPAPASVPSAKDEPKAEASNADAPKDPAKADAAKVVAPKNAPKVEAPTPKADGGEPAKNEIPKAGAAKPEAPTGDTPASKPDTPKEPAPKGEAPKSDDAKPTGADAPKA